VKDDRLYLSHILLAVDRILRYTSGGEAAFRQDIKTQDAVIHNLQIIGEAAKRVSAETRAARPDIPWRNMAGLRDRVVHNYFGVSLDIVWDVAESHLPRLREQVASLLERS
jgi:uncharacterized protein with HEPN domain